MTRRQVNVGIIGTGWIVRAHVHALHTLNHLKPLPCRVRVRALYGRREESASALASELDVERWTTDWNELVADPEMDVIANVGPHAIHAPISIAALEAGKHVLCEKPLATSTDEAREMEEAAASSRPIRLRLQLPLRAGDPTQFSSLALTSGARDSDG